MTELLVSLPDVASFNLLLLNYVRLFLSFSVTDSASVLRVEFDLNDTSLIVFLRAYSGAALPLLIELCNVLPN